MRARRHTYPDANAAAAACAAHILALLEEALSTRAFATLALSGGASPKPLFERLAAERRFQWDKVHFFWVDERAVPPTDPASNYKSAYEALLIPAKAPPANIHRIHGELTPDVAARRYAQEIRALFGIEEGEMPRFDVVHCGLGSDGHTASLFPGDPLVDDREGIAAAVRAPAGIESRVTLLPGALLAARNTAFLVTGAEKAGIVRAVLEGPYEPSRYPAQLLLNVQSARIFLDEAAARLLAGND